MSQTIEDILREYEQLFPPVLQRNHPRFQEWMGVSPRTMANLDAKGKGPRERVQNGKFVGYPKAAAIDWKRKRIKEAQS